ncbi:hypothetical protein VZT92_021240 [Zoarces viviparus]|uniref:Secreted protein n=1 Tax=Zoarces viviparus TaxID=48416 RepID=A0AAW1EGY4_ZOAVI
MNDMVFGCWSPMLVLMATVSPIALSTWSMTATVSKGIWEAANQVFHGYHPAGSYLFHASRHFPLNKMLPLFALDNLFLFLPHRRSRLAVLV